MIFIEDLPLEERNRIIEEKKKTILEDFQNTPTIGYRCEQFNITKVEERPTFTAHTKSQFELKLASLKGELKQTDFYCDFSMKGLNEVSEVLKELDYIRNHIFFELNPKTGKIQKILNKKSMGEAWCLYRDNELPNVPFIKKNDKKDNPVLDEIVKNGNMQFSDQYPIIEEYDRSLFHHILFNKYLTSDLDVLKDDILYTPSQLFRDIMLKIDISYNIKKTTPDFTTVEKIGTLDKRVLDMAGIKERYDYNYKPLVNYSFTDFDLMYNIIFTIDNKTKQITEGKASISETVRNNCENITTFTLKQIQL